MQSNIVNPAQLYLNMCRLSNVQPAHMVYDVRCNEDCCASDQRLQVQMAAFQELRAKCHWNMPILGFHENDALLLVLAPSRFMATSLGRR